MEHTRLVQLLATFRPAESRAFRKWLASPYHNQRPDVQALYRLYEQCCKTGKSLPDKPQIFQHLFPNEVFDDHRIRLAMSLLLRLAEQFLTTEEFLKDPLRFRTSQLGMYRRRGLPDHFQRTLQDTRQLHRQQPLRHPAWYWAGYEIEVEDYLFQATERRNTALNLQEAGNQLDLAYLLLKLRQSCIARSHQAVFRVDYDFGLLPLALATIETRQYLEQPAFAVYYQCYQSLIHPLESSHFEAFKQALYAHGAIFPPDESRDLYLLAINYCIQRYNQGNRAYLEEEMELYERGLHNKMLLTGGYISRFTYRNVVSLGLALERFEFTEQFVHEYRSLLEPQHRNANFAFNMARIEYERKNYAAALELLQQSDYEDLLLNLAAKALLLKVYFEVNAEDSLDSHLDAMSNFVRRKKDLNYHRDHYLNLCRFVRKIRMLTAGDQSARLALADEIKNTPRLAYRDWLLEKVTGTPQVSGWQ